MYSISLVVAAVIVRQTREAVSPDELYPHGGDTSMYVSQTGGNDFWGDSESVAEGDMGELGSLDVMPPINERSAGERAGLDTDPEDSSMDEVDHVLAGELAGLDSEDSEDAPARSLTTSQGEQLALERAEAARMEEERQQQLADERAAGEAAMEKPWPTGKVLEICPIGGSSRDCGKQLASLADHVNDPVELSGVVVHGRYPAFKILGLQGNGEPGKGEEWRKKELEGSVAWREHLESSGVPVLWFNRQRTVEKALEAMGQVEEALKENDASGDRWFIGSDMEDYKAFVADPARANDLSAFRGNIRKIG